MKEILMQKRNPSLTSVLEIRSDLKGDDYNEEVVYKSRRETDSVKLRIDQSKNRRGEKE